MATHYQTLVIGGGTAGIMLAARLRREQRDLQIAIMEPFTNHWYQPGRWWGRHL